MGESNFTITSLELESEENLVAAVQYISKALVSKMSLKVETRKLLADLCVQLSTLTIVDDNGNDVGVCGFEEQFSVVKDKIMRWEADQSMIWDAGPDEVSDYLNAVKEIQKLIEKFESLSFSKNDRENELLRGAHDVLQMAMARLEEEFRYMLVQNKQPFELEHMSFRSTEEDPVDLSSVASFGDDSFEESLHRDSVSRYSEDLMVDLVNPEMIPDLRCIANLMTLSNYDQECSQAYINARKDALDECLSVLQIEKLSIEDVLKMGWGSLNANIKRWILAMKIFIRVYLASEKYLCEQIFGEQGSLSLPCFVEASKSPMFQLLNFGEAISIGPHAPEKLFCILDMYEVMSDVLPEIDALYSESGCSVRVEYHEVLRRLGGCLITTFLDFEHAVASNTSSNPLPGGGIHHLTKYVMNYIRLLTDYSDTLNFLLEDHSRENSVSLSPDKSPSREEEKKDPRASPVALQFQAIASVLESNLIDKSKLYKDASLQHIFMMNNIHYMTEKVKNSELQFFFEGKWIRKHNWNFQHHALEYERATWISILSLLKDEGIQNQGSNSISKTIVKERFRSFYLAFEDIYKTQTAWVIPDIQLREDLRISTSLKVIQAYRMFVGRFSKHISEKHIKYSADDLENYLLDLFEGTQKLLQIPHRR